MISTIHHLHKFIFQTHDIDIQKYQAEAQFIDEFSIVVWIWKFCNLFLLKF